MSEKIRVHVVREKDRANLTLRYVDPATGRQVKKSAGTSKMKEARDRAAVWADELQSGRYAAPSKLTWEDFRTRYEAEVVPGLAKKTEAMIGTVFNAVERITHPNRLADLNAAKISVFQGPATEEGRAEANHPGRNLATCRRRCGGPSMFRDDQRRAQNSQASAGQDLRR